MNKRRLVLTILLAIITAVLLSVCVSAEISVKKGVVVGLDPAVTYDYAPVTMSTYKSPKYTEIKGVSEISGLSAGLWYIYDRSTVSVTAVWIGGDTDKRTSIGEVYYNSSYKKDVVRASNGEGWKDGVWTGKGCFNHSTFATYYLSDLGGNHLTTTDAEKVIAGTISRKALRDKAQSIKYQYAYAPEEIMPIEELYSLAFSTGVRQGSIQISYSDDADDPITKTKYVLYTMEKDGSVSSHVALLPSAYSGSGAKNSHTLRVKDIYPDATGWVIGIEVYPYGDIPIDGLSFSHIGSRVINTIFYLEFNPSGYTTKYKGGSIQIPFQYNGINKSYVDGYADGTFKPDSAITKAEAIALLAKIIGDLGEDKPGDPGFADCTVNDWFYDDVSFISWVGGLSHIDGARLHPNEAITRGELAQILFSLALPDKSTSCSFKDVDSTNPYYTAICSLEAAGVIDGYSDRTFRPYGTITRAETVTMINRLINLKADETTMVKESVKNHFPDAQGHWAEYQIIMASNDNVKTPHHLEASASGLFETENTIQFETDYIRITINKSNGKTISVINKYDNSDITKVTATPWFTSGTTSSGFLIYPTAVAIVDNRLEVTYDFGFKAYFIFDIKDDFFTVELDSELPIGMGTLTFAQFDVDTPFSDEDEDSYRLSGVTMTAHTNSSYFPGGASIKTNAKVMKKFGCIGAKYAVAFSKFGGKVEGEHRALLKKIVTHIDPKLGAVSNHGGPYTHDYTDTFGDYVILSGGFTAATAKETAQVMKKYSIDQLDMHQGGSTFIQGEFNFVCAKESGETFTTAKQFYERVGYIAVEEGIQIGMHTYSSLVPANATTILKNPKWQQQISYDTRHVLTLAEGISASVRVFPTNEDASTLTMAETAVPWSGPATQYYLIEEEIVRATAFDSTGLTTVTRGQCGTTAASHPAGAEIRQLQCWYGMFQPIPGSELFYHIADLTAKSFNEGNFEMIYLDGLESFSPFVPSSEAWYYYATFIQRVISGCERSPIIEGSAFPLGFWTSRARGGAWDHSHRDYKNFNANHLKSNKNLLNYYCTATMGWFHYSPDMGSGYKNTTVKTVFRDDLDHMGSICVAYDMTTVCQPFSVANFKTYKSLADNTLYFSLYSRLRKGGYFSPNVKKTLRLGITEGKEYKLEEQADGSWAFREMTYLKNKILDNTDDLYISGKGTNLYDKQTPYIRIEQRFSTLGANEQVIYDFDDSVQVVAGQFDTVAAGGTDRQAYKIKVYGNNSSTNAIMLSLNNELNFCIPLNFSGWREFILMDADNSDHPGYTFSGENEYFRGTMDFNITSVKVILCGTCTGVRLDDLIACTAVNSPASMPTVTVGNSSITFGTTVRSGEYIEYFPELNKAYLHSYAVGSNGKNGVAKTVTEIPFEGLLTVPEGDFTYTYSAFAEAEAPLRAQVVLGLKSEEIIANEDTWVAPKVELDEDLQWVTLK